MSGQYRRWCFTSYDASLIADLREWTEEGDRQTVLETKLREHNAQYAVFQLEQCPGTERAHIQGYARFKTAKRNGGMREILEAHFERTQGDESSNIKYCTKDETRIAGPWTFGDPARPGQRSDIPKAIELLEETGRMRDVVEIATSYQAIRHCEIVLKYKEPKRNWMPIVKWYHGSTGSGKTRAAIEECPEAWISGKNLRWWEAYDAHSEVIVDDFRRDYCTFHDLLRITDRYPMRVENKGGSRELLAKVIIFTCPYSPEECWKGHCQEDIGQFLRRISEVKLFGEVVLREDAQPQASHYVNPPM